MGSKNAMDLGSSGNDETEQNCLMCAYGIISACDCNVLRMAAHDKSGAQNESDEHSTSATLNKSPCFQSNQSTKIKKQAKTVQKTPKRRKVEYAKCPHCPKVMLRFNLKPHLDKVHIPLNANCRICETTLSSVTAVNEHESSHHWNFYPIPAEFLEKKLAKKMSSNND
ncbi:hypothetical protein B9Z55_007141 [Caenorhabditis nigoni]|nr:hypothetical protein B9Z55_007140 [Caenorhabditis nigoni]PIC47995.1 hypothetical protein B9Z55_007141 [Caenorhabditis nigoni]